MRQDNSYIRKKKKIIYILNYCRFSFIIKIYFFKIYKYTNYTLTHDSFEYNLDISLPMSFFLTHNYTIETKSRHSVNIQFYTLIIHLPIFFFSIHHFKNKNSVNKGRMCKGTLPLNTYN